MTKEEMIKAAKIAYYNTGEPIMSDFEYDRLVAEVGYESVGAPILDGVKKIKMTDKPMLSLAKCHSAEEIKNFAKGQDLVASIKCDGLSCRIIYENGELVSANTRGDGEVGQDITEHVKQFENVPLTIEYKNRLVVDGEAIIRQKDFDEINKNREFKNPRNLAAGTLASLDTSLCRSRRMSFIAWDLIEPKMNLYNEGLNYLEDQCFFNVVTWQYCVSSSDNYSYEKINNKIIRIAKEQGIPCDGVVWKYNDVTFDTTNTAHHFNNGIAWKEAIKEYETELLEIDYDISRNGILTPVAVFKPIEIDGAEVSRASLHNLSVMWETLGKHPDYLQPIWIFKANEIIPQVSRAVKNDIRHDHVIPDVLDYCPICFEDTEIRVSDAGVQTLCCSNPNCAGKINKRIEHYCDRTHGMDIRGLSLKTIEKLNEKGWLNEIKDLYVLAEHKKDWCSMEGFGEKSVQNILDAIEKSKECKLESFISALGIPLIGRRVAKEIVKYYPTWESFREAIGGRWSDIDGFGPEMELALNSFDYAEADLIAASYLRFETIESSHTDTKAAAALNICITGKLGNVWKKRDDLIAFVEDKGGKVSSSVSSKTTHLVNNDVNSTSSKNVKAKQLNIPIITEEELMEMLK